MEALVTLVSGGRRPPPRASWSDLAYLLLRAVALRSWTVAMAASGLPRAPLRWTPIPTKPSDRIAAVLARYLLQTTRLLARALRLLLMPEAVVRQILAVAALQSLYELSRWSSGLLRRGVPARRRRQRLERRAERADSYAEWRRAERALDDVVGHTAWRAEDDERLFNAAGLRKRVAVFRALQSGGDARTLMFHLRSGLLRKHFAATNAKLYARSRVGTKRSVEEYVRTLVDCLRFVADEAPADDEELLAERLAFFNETRHAFGRTALLLSGGAAMGLYHVGVIKTLLAQGLLPKVIAGASAGSIVAAIVGVHTDEELPAVLSGASLNLRFFAAADHASDAERRGSSLGELWNTLAYLLPGAAGRAAQAAHRGARLALHWRRHGTLLDIETLERNLRDNIGELTFAEAYHRTGRIVSITVSSTTTTQQQAPMLLNYLTAPNVLMWSAALASSAIPGVFAPVELLAKDAGGRVVPYFPEGLKWSDGSVECDLPSERLAELFNVNQVLVSQVNPHARIFATTSVASVGPLRDLIGFLKQEVRSYIVAAMALLTRSPLKPLGIGLVPFVTQQYEGDITVVPTRALSWLESFRDVLRNPSPAEFAAIVRTAERATWPLVNRVKMQCAVEFALDEHVRALRLRLAAVSSGGRQSGGGDTEGAGGMHGRVPSFYTSASMLNLSELDAGAPGVVVPVFGYATSSRGSSPVGSPRAGSPPIGQGSSPVGSPRAASPTGDGPPPIGQGSPVVLHTTEL